MQLVTERLVVAPLRGEELADFLPVYESNPAYRALTEGSAGEPGRYDLGMLERDFAVARLVPGRVFAGIRLRDNGDPVGLLDWLERHPEDGTPWIGLVMVHSDRQGHGFAAEAVDALCERLRRDGETAVRAAVIAGNAQGAALAERLGFRQVGKTTRRLAAADQPVRIMERALSQPGRNVRTRA